MNLTEALNIARAEHVYVVDPDGGRGDSWNVTARGDCEDFSFYVIWLMSDKSRLKFIRNILFGGFTFHYVMIKDWGHFVTEKDGLFFDNVFKRAVGRNVMVKPANGYVFVKTFSKLRVLLKIAFT